MNGVGALLAETHTEALTALFHVERWIASGRTRYQQWAVVEVPGLGRMLFLDGKSQSSQLDEHVYHEALVQPALTLHPEPRAVAVCGGGEGATLRELLSHDTVRRATMIDIDGELHEIAREHLVDWHRGAFDDPRAEVLTADARDWLESVPEGSLDVLISDLPDPLPGGPAVRLFTRELFVAARRALEPDGIFCMQAGSAALTHLEFGAAMGATLADVFPLVVPIVVSIETYLEPWLFLLATAGADPRALAPAEVARRQLRRGVSCRRYQPDFHQAMLTAPEYMLDAIASAQIVTDAAPMAWEA